jgi:DNA invertase Pin-like site-specific DNA recombinase
MGALAEFERSLISERTRAGIAAARARGKSIGRPAKLTAHQVDALSKELQLHDGRIRDVAESFAVSKSTVRRALERSQKQRA